MWETRADEPTAVITHVRREDGSTETREDTVVRYKPKAHETLGRVNAEKTQKRAREMANGLRGRRLSDRDRERRRRERERREDQYIQERLIGLSDRLGEDIRMNLLEKSGLTGNMIKRDLNLLESAVGEAAYCLRAESGLADALDTHFGLDRIALSKKGKVRADGSTIASLLWMNAAMLHQRVHSGRWLSRAKLHSLNDIKSSTEPVRLFQQSWNAIARQDFRPVIDPAIEALEAAEATRLLGGLHRALRHLAGEAERIAETYADMGTDHAGELFNNVMGDQASDGAFFTRPTAADLAARLTLSALDPHDRLDWSDPGVWRNHKTVDPACGSGTLLAAVMAEMKRRAAFHGADNTHLGRLQKIAVEETIKGLDINPVSLQLAASQLMAGNIEVKYRRMGLHQMEYGPTDQATSVSMAAGSLELLGRQDIINAGRLFDDSAAAVRVVIGAESQDCRTLEGPEMDDAAEDIKAARIVIMNPPFTNRRYMAQKFGKDTQEQLRKRVDSLQGLLTSTDPDLEDFVNANTIGPLFVALADHIVDRVDGIMTLIRPTIVTSSHSSAIQRKVLAERFHVDTILTCHSPGDINLSQHTSINESLLVFKRRCGPAPTRVISLDRFPHDNEEVGQLFEELAQTRFGTLGDSWGEVSLWARDRIVEGDWTAAVWRSPVLADAAARYTTDPQLQPLKEIDLSSHSTGQQLRGGA